MQERGWSRSLWEGVGELKLLKYTVENPQRINKNIVKIHVCHKFFSAFVCIENNKKRLLRPPEFQLSTSFIGGTHGQKETRHVWYSGSF